MLTLIRALAFACASPKNRENFYQDLIDRTEGFHTWNSNGKLSSIEFRFYPITFFEMCFGKGLSRKAISKKPVKKINQ